MNTRDRILLRTPPAVQSVLVTIGSGMRAGHRYGRTFKQALESLEASERLSSDARRDRQKEWLRAVLERARQEVPHYRAVAANAEALGSWPVLEKREVQDRLDDFVSEKYRRKDLLRAETSGTSGSPLSVFYTVDAYQWEMAFRWRHRAWAGIPFGARGAYFAGHLVAPATRRNPPFWIYDGAEQRLLFSSYHMNERTLPAYVARLAAFDPVFLHGYPSSLVLVAQAVLRSATRPRPRAVFAASETLFAHQRALIEEAFGCKVYVWYGQTEMTCNIVECSEGSLHVREDYGLLESLPDGSVLGTGLRNPAMPFIRYRLGDQIEVSDDGCRCGREFPRAKSIVGRVEDYIVTPEGTRVGRLDHLLKGAVGVAEAQIVQDRADEVQVHIVRGLGYSEETERAILREAAVRLGPSVRVVLQQVASIPRGPNGKFRFVISRAASTFAGVDAHTMPELTPPEQTHAIASPEATER